MISKHIYYSLTSTLRHWLAFSKNITLDVIIPNRKKKKKKKKKKIKIKKKKKKKKTNIDIY